MINGWAVFIMFAVALANTCVGTIRVRRIINKEEQFWGDDYGPYLPWFISYEGFHRGLIINLSFAVASLGLAAVFLRGDSSFASREAIVAMLILSLVWSIIIAYFIRPDFEPRIRTFTKMWWKIFGFTCASLLLYGIAGWIVVAYCLGLPKQ